MNEKQKIPPQGTLVKATKYKGVVGYSTGWQIEGVGCPVTMEKVLTDKSVIHFFQSWEIANEGEVN